MKTEPLLRRYAVCAGRRSALAIVVFLAVACTSSASEPPAAATATPETATDATSFEADEETITPALSPLGTIVVSASECTVDGIEAPVSEGPVALTIVNETEGPAVANMSRILDGGSFAELEAHVRKEIRLAHAGKPALGHPTFAPPSFDLFVAPGESDTLIGEVTSGTYAIVCGRVFEEVGEVRPSAVLGPYEVR